VDKLFTQRVAALILTPDGNSEHRWCRNGDPCRDGISLECLTTESDDQRDHMKGEITGAGVATLAQGQ